MPFPTKTETLQNWETSLKLPDSTASMPQGSGSQDGDGGPAIVPTGAAYPILVIYQGNKPRGAPIEVRGDIFLIGRSSRQTIEPPDLDFAQLTDGERVSRRHARIIQQAGRYFIEDLHSSRGTWVNDDRVKPEAVRPLAHGDWINIAEVAELQFLQSSER